VRVNAEGEISGAMMACYSAAQSEKWKMPLALRKLLGPKSRRAVNRIIPVSDPFHVTILEMRLLEMRLAGLKESTYNSGVRLTVALLIGGATLMSAASVARRASLSKPTGCGPGS
jgi:hypothetical protein